MAEPVEYLIVRNLQAALAGIAVSEGFHFDVQATAVKLDPDTDVEALIAPEGPRPFVLIEAFAEDAPEEWGFHPAGELQLTMPVTIHFVTSEVDQTRDEERLSVFLRSCADVERAIAADHGRGGHAVDTRIRKRRFRGVASEVWAVVDVDILVVRTYGQPDS